jgi:hypothetical protein
VGAVVKYEVGQKVWFQSRDRTGTAGERTITSVGRKWVQLDHGRYRVKLGSCEVDGAGYSSPGTLYSSKEEYEQHLVVVHAWTNLRRTIERSWYPPDGITLESIQAAAAELGFTMEDK